MLSLRKFLSIARVACSFFISGADTRIVAPAIFFPKI